MFFGENGAGKTSIIESLVLLAKGRTFRSSTTAPLIGPRGSDILVVAECVGDDERVRAIGLRRDAKSWEARVDGNAVNNLGELATYLPLTLLEPNSHFLISGAPDFRRRFIDWGVFHVKPAFLDLWRRYSRAVKQRNAALRSGDREVVTSLDPLVSVLGEEIDASRQQFVGELSRVFEDQLQRLSPELEDVELRYRAGWSSGALVESLRGALDGDLERGVTSVGPHRGDLLIRMGGKLVRDRVSRGEQKVLAAALLLSQAQVISTGGSVPLLLFDDLASEFDGDHVRRVVENGFAFGAQMWVTATIPEPYDRWLGKSGRLFHVKQGNVLAVES